MFTDPSQINDDELALFPPYQDYLRNLEALRQMDFSDSSLAEIGQAINDNAVVINHLHAWLSPEKLKEVIFYRVRLNINSETEDLGLIRTYSYPLPTFCRENGRANLKGKSVFYCSDNPITAILECKPQIGDIGYLSIWSLNCERDLKAGVCLSPELPKENPWNKLATDVNYFGVNKSRQVGKDKTEHLIASQKFIADQFVCETPPYYITSLVASQMMYGTSWKDLIVYPSFTTRSFSCNIAFHPNIVDLFLKFNKVIRFKVIEINDGLIKLSTGRIGEIATTNIQWRNARKEEIDFASF